MEIPEPLHLLVRYREDLPWSMEGVVHAQHPKPAASRCKRRDVRPSRPPTPTNWITNISRQRLNGRLCVEIKSHQFSSARKKLDKVMSQSRGHTTRVSSRIPTAKVRTPYVHIITSKSQRLLKLVTPSWVPSISTPTTRINATTIIEGNNQNRRNVCAYHLIQEQQKSLKFISLQFASQRREK